MILMCVKEIRKNAILHSAQKDRWRQVALVRMTGVVESTANFIHSD
jgi:hypothetical protein